MRKRFGLFESERNHNNRILVMEVGNGITGFVVDAVTEVLRISSAEIQPPPSITQSSVAQDCITGVINHAERLLIVLDLDRLFSDEEKAVFEMMG